MSAGLSFRWERSRNMDIKEIRRKLGITQNDLAARLGVTARTVQNWENGGAIPSTTTAKLEAMMAEESRAGDDSLNLTLALRALSRSQDEIDRLIGLLERRENGTC